VNLQYAVITSPIDGVVISRAVDVGQTVAASLQAPTLFTIAQDLREMQIATNIDEADIGSLKEGMDATFTVDSYPDETFHGRITQIRYAAQTDQSVVTYPVIITVANPDIKLRPGMTANVTVVTAERETVVRLPATALRFKPPESATAVKPAAGGAVASPTPGAATERPRGQRRGGHRGDSTATAAGEERKMATVYVKGLDGKLEARRVTTGLNNGTYVELLSGELSPGDSVVVGMAGLSAANAAASRMPGMGGPMGGGPRR
jgi:HlyD family secretion protein